ncbi:MAG: sugar phosphate isomerase/epimerase [Planctomycetota bacterium]|nr:sugar phosphate isomerase/epimerase [Planctomycetota bacterium]MDA1105533.1 sugar phosphate isomerase/epimerase [Planctomycetota bacterium]
MKLGVMSALFAGRTLDDVALTCAEAGLNAIELPVGAYPGKPFFEPSRVLASTSEQSRIRSLLKEHGLELSGLAVHGNPVHPDTKIARSHHDAYQVAVKLAPKLGTDVVITFGGCPGGSARDKTPNWVTCPWPNDFTGILAYQWDEVLVPYWSAQAKLCAKHGVKTAWEAHPGFAVYNPDTIIRLSERATKASGLRGKPILGANLDPSHFFWQGIDPVLAARTLGEAGLLFYVHAKDTELDRHEGPVNGYLDARPYGDLNHRSWSFRTCGYGHGMEFWKPFVSMLRRYGYDHVLSIEHEDALMSVEEGFLKAVEFLGEVLLEEDAAKPWWT